MDVLMPQLGETVAEGKISKWFVSAGDAVKPGDNLFEIETDKVSMEVPAISAGVLSAINVPAGEIAPVGAVVAVILGAGEKAPTSPSLIPVKAGIQRHTSTHAAATAARPPIPMEPFREVRTPERNYGPARLAGGMVVTPLARRLAGEAGIDLASIKGSGPHGRIVSADVEGAKRTKVASPAPTQTPAGAHIVLTADVGIAHALALCMDGPAIELTDIVVKAWAAALARMMPSEPSDIALVIGKSRPVVGNVASKSLTAIATARRGFGSTDATQGAATAISMPGVAGITAFADVLRPAQTTMLSVGAARRAPIEAADGSVKFADMITVTLTCDAQVVDGALGAGLLSAFKGFIERPVTMIV